MSERIVIPSTPRNVIEAQTWLIQNMSYLANKLGVGDFEELDISYSRTSGVSLSYQGVAVQANVPVNAQPQATSPE